MKVRQSRSLFFTIEISLIFIALAILKRTDSYYANYLILGLLGSIATHQNFKSFHFKPLPTFFASFLSLCATLANYRIFTEIASQDGIYLFLAPLSAVLVFLGCFVIFQNLLLSIKHIQIKTTQNNQATSSRLKFFFTCFAIFAIIDLAILFLFYYPGITTNDSLDEINQALSGVYSNHHPFYFTLLIKFFLSIGIDIFHDINSGIALFSVFQIIVISSAFSYSLLTLYEKGVSKKLLLIIAVLIAILPYNITYSFTMWKDVLFGALFLVFTVSLYRYFSFPSPKRQIVYVLIFVSATIISLYRSNAFIAIIASVILFFIIFKKLHLKLGIVLVSAAFVAFILKTPVLGVLGIRGPDNLEALAIPMQQVTRTLVEKHSELSTTDLDLIKNLAEPATIIDAYDANIHDPVKNLIRIEGSQHFLSEHLLDYTMLYFRLGVKYPTIYLKAWIDQTRGYWNGGYDYWKWSTEIDSNDLGITNTATLSASKSSFETYLDLFEKSSFLTPLVSIGFAVWTIVALFYLAIARKNRPLIFILIPFIMVLGTLLVSAPVFSEFRYTYFIFTCLPFLTIISLIKKEHHEKR